jgi:thioesterase domain-containing protein/acyl carrier protein
MTDVSALGSSVPIGRPIANTQVYILDAQLQPVPIGVPGQLYTGGDGLARGYLNRPELTAEKFISDPFSEDPAARLYKTGDLARYLPDGSIEFLGRIDHQVKIRGFRIELGEVESVLGRHPAVEEAVVIAREDVPGDKRLVAYVVASHEPTPSFSELRSFLKEKLPDYMIPSAFVDLGSLPLTPNGKVDRKALPAPDRNRIQPAEALVAPRDDLELQLTKIWEKVLGVKNIGMKDNFFDLGGHSLLIVRLFDRIQKIFGKDLPLATLFQAPTIGQLARIIRQEGWSSPWSSLVPIQHGGSKPPFFCVHGCTGKVEHFYDLARLLGPEQPFYGLSALGLEKGQVPHTQFEDMAAHYIKEIRTIQFNGPYFIGGSGAGYPIVIEMAHQLESQGQNVTLLVLMTPFSLKPNRSSKTFSKYFKFLKIYFSLFNIVIKTRIVLPTIKHVFFNRVLWHLRICHRFIPGDIHRKRRFVDDFIKARMSYKPEPYQGRITCFLFEEFSQNHKKVIGNTYDLAAGGLDVRFVPGNIFTMWREPHVQKLSEQLTACLNEAQKKVENL